MRAVYCFQLPPRTCPLVQMADIDRAVSVVTTLASRMTSDARPIPACPTTHDILRNSITPKMFSTHRTYNNITACSQSCVNLLWINTPAKTFTPAILDIFQQAQNSLATVICQRGGQTDARPFLWSLHWFSVRQTSQLPDGIADVQSALIHNASIPQQLNPGSCSYLTRYRRTAESVKPSAKRTISS